MLWERNIGHSVRPDYVDGFLFPYQEALRLAEREGVDPEEFVAFAPDEHFDAYSYGSELLSHDGAVASPVACAAALHRIRDRIEGPWDRALTWIDTQLNRLWKARGAFCPATIKTRDREAVAERIVDFLRCGDRKGDEGSAG